MKNKNKQPSVVNKYMSFKKVVQKLCSKGNRVVKGMEGVEYEENVSDVGEVYEEGFDGNVRSIVDARSVDSRSCGESVSGKNIDTSSERDMVRMFFFREPCS